MNTENFGTTLKARYSTLKTIMNNGFDAAEFIEYIAGYGYTTRIELGCIAIVNEDGESVDHAHPIVISHKGVRHYDVILSEMESFFEINGESFSTINDEVELPIKKINKKYLK